MTMSSEIRTPANGSAIPAIGFGTYGMNREQMLRMIPAALKAGFRHIDTAQLYRNETEVGECVEASGIARGDLYLTTKVWSANYGARDFARSVDESLACLRTDYIDLLLLHWPGGSNVPLADQIGSLNEAVRAGKVRHIGVSNFNRALMREAVRLSDEPLATNQFEYHPYLNQSLLLEATRELGMTATAYCGMAVGRVFEEAVLQRIAATHGRSVAQIVLRWLVQQDHVAALSRTTNIERLPENLSVFDFALSASEMEEIYGLAVPYSRIVSPSGLSPVWDPT
ncbi:aldo/keto reductase [Sphingobium sp. EM0848]|uniref:aldo/keto reductase n=1 Tax=Sphingobium sp. EM0848 TaxID=2743473 RepID=UPI002101C45F|nr:aldo/keto reductase [Sphingobium sp. EM0848]